MVFGRFIPTRTHRQETSRSNRAQWRGARWSDSPKEIHDWKFSIKTAKLFKLRESRNEKHFEEEKVSTGGCSEPAEREAFEGVCWPLSNWCAVWSKIQIDFGLKFIITDYIIQAFKLWSRFEDRPTTARKVWKSHFSLKIWEAETISVTIVRLLVSDDQAPVISRAAFLFPNWPSMATDGALHPNCLSLSRTTAGSIENFNLKKFFSAQFGLQTSEVPILTPPKFLKIPNIMKTSWARTFFYRAGLLNKLFSIKNYQ